MFLCAAIEKPFCFSTGNFNVKIRLTATRNIRGKHCEMLCSYWLWWQPLFCQYLIWIAWKVQSTFYWLPVLIKGSFILGTDFDRIVWDELWIHARNSLEMVHMQCTWKLFITNVISRAMKPSQYYHGVNNPPTLDIPRRGLVWALKTMTS